MSLLNAPFISEFLIACNELAQTDWHEYSAGNISLLLSPKELEPYLASLTLRSSLHLNEHFQGEVSHKLSSLTDHYILITASGAKFKHITQQPEKYLALLQIDSSNKWKIVWGLANGGKPSSELLTHLLGHEAQMKSKGYSRYILHSHPTNIISYSFNLHHSDDGYIDVSKFFWRLHSEALVIFPKGIHSLELMKPGGEALALRTAKLLEKYDFIIWAKHGCVVTADHSDDCIGKIQVAEKVIEIALKSMSISHHISFHKFFASLHFAEITDNQLRQLAEHYGLKIQI